MTKPTSEHPSAPDPLPPQASPADNLERLIRDVEEDGDVDVIIYNGGIYRPADDNLIELCASKRCRENVLLFLTTFGGDPHAAFRIARALQQYYKRFTLFVPGDCKSAGTLIALGAHEIVLAKHTELGPLDIQVLKPGELGDRISGLTPTDSLNALNASATNAFTVGFLTLRRDLLMTTTMAAETSAALVTGLYKGIYDQIDPLRLGEVDRAMRVMLDYGKRLIEVSQNAQESTLMMLLNGYPSHGFVIDGQEARKLFKRVREPTVHEQALNEHIEVFTRTQIDAPQPSVMFLSEKKEPTHDQPQHAGHSPADKPTPAGEGDGSAASAGDASDPPATHGAPPVPGCD